MGKYALLPKPLISHVQIWCKVLQLCLARYLAQSTWRVVLFLETGTAHGRLLINWFFRNAYFSRTPSNGRNILRNLGFDSQFWLTRFLKDLAIFWNVWPLTGAEKKTLTEVKIKQPTVKRQNEMLWTRGRLVRLIGSWPYSSGFESPRLRTWNRHEL